MLFQCRSNGTNIESHFESDTITSYEPNTFYSWKLRDFKTVFKFQNLKFGGNKKRVVFAIDNQGVPKKLTIINIFPSNSQLNICFRSK